jgi:hypothetical protein
MFAVDTKGLTKMALDAIEMIRMDPDLAGVHVMGGLTNIGLNLPKREYDGLKLQNAVERAFLTVAVPRGFDTALATPWQDYSPLPADHPVLLAFKELVELRGGDFIRKLRQFVRG